MCGCMLQCGCGLRDGATQEAGSCVRDFRNKPNPVKLRIIYLRGILEVGLWLRREKPMMAFGRHQSQQRVVLVLIM